MKVIDLLVKKANGEKMPKKIKYVNGIYELHERFNNVYNYKNREGKYFEDEWLLSNILNHEVEIIEDTPKEIYFDEEDIKAEKEEMKKLSIEKKDNFYDYYKEDKKIEKLDYIFDIENPTYKENWLMCCIEANKNKINEIIELLNNSMLLSEKEVGEFLDKVNGE